MVPRKGWAAQRTSDRRYEAPENTGRETRSAHRRLGDFSGSGALFRAGADDHPRIVRRARHRPAPEIAIRTDRKIFLRQRHSDLAALADQPAGRSVFASELAPFQI